jgi:hypothetical protein
MESARRLSPKKRHNTLKGKIVIDKNTRIICAHTSSGFELSAK